MATPQSLHHALLRPCVLHILRAAGFHTTRPSVLDAFTDIAARFMVTIAESTLAHAAINQGEPEIAIEIAIQDVRMAMEACGVMFPVRPLMDKELDGREEDDIRSVEAFTAWAMGPKNKEIRRIAFDGGDGSKDDYLAVLKKKHATTDEDSRYNGTLLGKPAEHRTIKIEGGNFTDITSLDEFRDKLQKESAFRSIQSSRQQSSALSSLGDEEMDEIDF